MRNAERGWRGKTLLGAGTALGLGVMVYVVSRYGLASQTVIYGSLAFLGVYLLWLSQVSERVFPHFLVIPSLLIMLAVIVVPIGYLIYVSFHRVSLWNFNSEWPFVGFQNYINLLTNDPLFLPSLVRSLQLLVFGLFFQILFGLSLALLFDRNFLFKPILSTILLLPIMTNSVVVGMVWKHMLNYYNGFINLALSAAGGTPQPWLTNIPLPFFQKLPLIGDWLVTHFNFNYAFLSIIVTNTWQYTPMVFLLCAAGLSSLPVEPFEAAKVDGASYWQTLRYLTLPMLKPVIGVVIVIRGIDIMKTFGMIWALFGNAPFTRTLNIHIHTLGLSSHNYGNSSALSLIVSALTIVLYYVFQKFSSER